MQPVIDHQRDFALRISALQVANDSHGGIAQIVNPKHNLDTAGIILKAKALQIGVKARLMPI